MHGVPGVVVCPYVYISKIHWLDALGEIAKGLIAAASGAFICRRPVSPI